MFNIFWCFTYRASSRLYVGETQSVHLLIVIGLKTRLLAFDKHSASTNRFGLVQCNVNM